MYNIEQELEEEEEDSKVQEFATMAEQIEAQRLKDLQNSSDDSSDEEDEQKEDGPDIFADDMALGEEASTLESHPSKADESIKISSVVMNKQLRKPFQAFKPRKK